MSIFSAHLLRSRVVLIYFVRNSNCSKIFILSSKLKMKSFLVSLSCTMKSISSGRFDIYLGSRKDHATSHTPQLFQVLTLFWHPIFWTIFSFQGRKHHWGKYCLNLFQIIADKVSPIYSAPSILNLEIKVSFQP